MMKYVTHDNSEDGQKTVIVLADEDGRVYKLDMDEIPIGLIHSERDTLARLHHDINHWGYEPPECCHCLSFHAFAPHFCGLDHPMDYFRVYCATCPDVNKQIETVFNKEPEVFEVKDFDFSKATPIELKPPTQEEIEKTRRDNHCRV